jgi:23S rRNA (uracil1939-C5)-methyltransferase
MIRVGARTGERLVVVAPTADDVLVPPDVAVVGADQLAAGRRAWVHEEVAGRRWRISAGSFFQAGPEGAEALVGEVGALVKELAPPGGRLVDLCSGVGLFAGTVGGGRSVTGVERSAPAVADARHNLAHLDARMVKVALARWRPSPAQVVVADPARRGLGRDGVRAVVGTGAEACVLVSCDPAALGRDVGLLGAAGYRHHRSVVLDLFGHTSGIEVVSGFARATGGGTHPR